MNIETKITVGGPVPARASQPADKGAPVVTIHPAAEGGYTVHGPDGVHTQGETLRGAVAALAEALLTLPADLVPDPAPKPSTAAPIEGSVAAVGGPSEPTVGSPEGRAIIDAEVRLRGWVQDADGDWSPPNDPSSWPIVWHAECCHSVRIHDSEWVERVDIPLDRPVSEAIAAIRRLHPLPSADTREGWTVDDLRADLAAAQTSIREATHTLATALDHDTEAALVLETAAEEVVRRWRRDREQLVDAHDVLDAAGVTSGGAPAERIGRLIDQHDIDMRLAEADRAEADARADYLDDRRLLVLAAALIAVAPDVAARLGVSLG